jgi:hypothetical protein
LVSLNISCCVAEITPNDSSPRQFHYLELPVSQRDYFLIQPVYFLPIKYGEI